jgi:hypothetical protein
MALEHIENKATLQAVLLLIALAGKDHATANGMRISRRSLTGLRRLGHQ